MSTKIAPTVGRIVWFYENADRSKQPMAAQVCFVHDDGRVNLSVTDHFGYQLRRERVPLVQDGEAVPDHEHCCWMPYQVGQAAKHAK